MAITKIHPIKSTLKKAIDYIADPAKTDDKLLVSSFGCAVETADLEFEKTRLLAMQKGNNLAHHLIQAFEPGEVSYPVPQSWAGTGQSIVASLTFTHYFQVI